MSIKKHAVFTLACAIMLVFCNCNFGNNPVEPPQPFEPFEPSTPPALSEPYVPKGPVVLIDKEILGLIEGGCAVYSDTNVANANSKALIHAIDSITKAGYYRLELEKGVYCIRGSENAYAIKIPSNVHLNLGGSTLELMPNHKTYSALLRIEFARNVRVFNGTLIGDKHTHDYLKITSDHGGGAGIWVYSSINIHLDSLTIRDVVSDCIIVGEISPICYNVTISNLTCSGARRDGIVGTNVDGLVIRDSHISNIQNDYPTYKDGKLIAIGAQACIAFETTKSDGTQRISNVEIYNNYLDGSAGTSKYNQLFLNTHGGSQNIVFRDNVAIGTYVMRYGKNMLFKNNKFYDGELHPDGTVNNQYSHTGFGENHIFEDNEFYNYRVISTGGTLNNKHPDYRQHFAWINNKFYNTDITLLSHTAMAFIDNEFYHASDTDVLNQSNLGDNIRNRCFYILVYENPPTNNVKHGLYFVNNKMSPSWTTGKGYVQYFTGGGSISLPTIDETPNRAKLIPSMLPDWYYESNSREEAMAFVNSWKWY